MIAGEESIEHDRQTSELRPLCPDEAGDRRSHDKTGHVPAAGQQLPGGYSVKTVILLMR
jgi:hypothetical protein